MIIMKNYWKMKGFSLLTVPYAYVDHSSHLADSLFVQNNVKMKCKEKLVRKNSPYCIIFCKVLKRDEDKFEQALGSLKDKMLLLGYRDYPDVCSEIDKIINKTMKERKVK